MNYWPSDIRGFGLTGMQLRLLFPVGRRRNGSRMMWTIIFGCKTSRYYGFEQRFEISHFVSGDDVVSRFPPFRGDDVKAIRSDGGWERGQWRSQSDNGRLCVRYRKSQLNFVEVVLPRCFEGHTGFGDNGPFRVIRRIGSSGRCVGLHGR